MPTTTFINLSKNKQDIIIEASLKEFKRVLLKDASINKIIKDANISRGSFYTYFKDINDLYIYSINNYKKEFTKILKETLEKTNGDLIKTTNIVYDKIIYHCIKDENRNLFKNIFLNMNYNTSIRNKILDEDIDNQYELIELILKIDKNKLNIETEEEIFYIVDMIVGFVIHGLIEIFMENKDSEIIKEKINKQLKILKRGIYKEAK